MRAVVHRIARLHLLQKPQPLLSIGQWQLSSFLYPHQRLARPRLLSPSQPRLQFLHYPRHRRLLEQHPQPQLHPERLPHPRDHLRGQQRVPPQLEKILLHSHSLHLQHLLPDPAHDLLFRIPRPLLLPPPPSCNRCFRFRFRLRQPLAIQLPVRRQRQLSHHHIPAGHHVLRQSPLQLLPQFTASPLPSLSPHSPHSSTFLRHYIGHQPLIATLIFPRHHHRLSHSCALPQGGFDLSQLDAETPHLYLLVQPPHKFQLPICPPPHLVSRLVQPLSSPCSVSSPSHKRVGHKPLRGQLRPVHIASGHSFSPDVHLSRYSHRHRLHLLIHHIHLCVRDGFSDRHVHARLWGAGPVSYVDSGFGRSIKVIKLCAAAPIELVLQFAAQRFTTANHP